MPITYLKYRQWPNGLKHGKISAINCRKEITESVVFFFQHYPKVGDASLLLYHESLTHRIERRRWSSGKVRLQGLRAPGAKPDYTEDPP
ncbi:hypothetical protein AVEN_179731-1, partial [Araneus ventricosus]